MLSMSSEINQQDKPTVLPPKSKQDALVSGYIRESIILYPFTLPICLIKLCLSFFNTIQYFKFEKETLTNFLNSTKDDIWEGKPFNIHGIMFRFALSPNGFIPIHTGQIGFFVKAKCLSPSIHRMVTKATLFCHETGAFYTNTKQETIPGKYDYDYEYIEIGSDYMISISDCKNKKCLTFSGKVEVLQIHYKSHISKPVLNCTNIEMRSNNNNYKWIIDRKSLKKELYFGKYIDNRYWVLFLHNGRIKLRLLDLPRNVISIAIKCNTKLKYYSFNNVILYENTFEVDCGFSLATNTRDVARLNSRQMDNTAPIPIQFNMVHKVLVDMELMMYGIFKRNCVSVPKQDWDKYGIIN
eukprot:19490_1